MRCMNELQVFTNPEFGTVRTMLIDNEPWAVGKDVAVALGYSNPQKAVRDHVDLEDRTVNDSFTVNGTSPTIINESGLYSLILSSKLPNAKRFKRWVTSEVLPTIRKTGSYTARNAEPEQRVLTPDDYIAAARVLSSCRNERLPYVLSLLKKAGLDIPKIETRQLPQIKPFEPPQPVKVIYPPRQQPGVTEEEKAKMRAELLARLPHLRDEYPDLKDE